MLNYLREVDVLLLQFINLQISNPVFDAVFPLITDIHKVKWLPFMLLFIWISLWKLQRRAFWIGFFLILTLAIGDFCGSIIKDFFMRLRPDMAGLEVILRSPHFGGGSFPSNHSLNLFCLAMFLSGFYPRAKKTLFITAILGAFSRVYCGVHFPSDVFAGAILGLLIGSLAFKLFSKVYSYLGEKK